uniref:Uncharacterized protein n=1 Tax=viral metagenome TaxID=1070528 RepID=A0A6C0H9M7_9ZZZZ
MFIIRTYDNKQVLLLIYVLSKLSKLFKLLLKSINEVLLNKIIETIII